MLHACCAGRELAAFPQPRYPTWISNAPCNALPFSPVSLHATSQLLPPPSRKLSSKSLAEIKKGTKAQSVGEKGISAGLQLPHSVQSYPFLSHALLLPVPECEFSRNTPLGCSRQNGTVAICDFWTREFHDLQGCDDKSHPASMAHRKVHGWIILTVPRSPCSLNSWSSMCKLYAACRSGCKTLCLCVRLLNP